MAEQQAFPKFELANCHPEPDIFYVVPAGHEHTPITWPSGEQSKCSYSANIASVSNSASLRDRFDAMQEILRRSNAYDELVKGAQAVLMEHAAYRSEAGEGMCTCDICLTFRPIVEAS